MTIYVLHFDPPYRHAGHYVGFTEDADPARRVAEHVEGRGRRPSPLVRAAVAAGCRVTLAATIPGDRSDERALKRRKSTRSYCPMCRADYNARAAARMRATRAMRRQQLDAVRALADVANPYDPDVGWL